MTLALEAHPSTSFKGDESRQKQRDLKSWSQRGVTILFRYKTTKCGLGPKTIRIFPLANDFRETTILHDERVPMLKMFRPDTQTQQNSIDMEPGHIKPVGEDI